MVYAYMSKGVDDVIINNARNNYLNASRDVVTQMTSRSEQTTTLSYPDSTNEDDIVLTTA